MSTASSPASSGNALSSRAAICACECRSSPPPSNGIGVPPSSYSSEPRSRVKNDGFKNDIIMYFDCVILGESSLHIQEWQGVLPDQATLRQRYAISAPPIQKV